jgi:acetoin utilization deacetylase AcuC-like enzyme
MHSLPIVYSEQFLRHQTGNHHPERPARLQAIVEYLQTEFQASQLDWRAPTPTSQRSPLPLIEQVHQLAYVQTVARMAQAGGGQLDPDTPISTASYDVALLAVNAWIDGVDIALQTQSPSLVLARPPGHHALPNQGMGFCVFANAAIAAYYALSQPGITRVAILDWDVHHGNGTQAIVETHPQLAYCSLHESPCYPYTGQASEQGNHQNVLNIPMSAGSRGMEYQAKFTQQILPWLNVFNPDLLIVSAGYDANQDDPLASIELQPQDYGVFTDACLGITRRVVFGLEGGYDLPSLAKSVAATVASCLAADPSGG